MPGVVFAPSRRGNLDVVEPERGQIGHLPIIARLATIGGTPEALADRLRRRYVLDMGDEQHKTEELKIVQAEREAAEREAAESALDEDEFAQHDRRADKARYLREKLEEREESERRLDQ